MGRPTDNPKPNRMTIRMDDGTLNKLNQYCAKHSLDRSEAIRRIIQRLDD